MIKIDLSGQVALVTGGGGGIGMGIGERLAEAGALVYLADINEVNISQAAEDINRKGGHAKTVQLDITNQDQVVTTIDKIAEINGNRLDILVNAAGICNIVPYMEAEKYDFERHMDINVIAADTLTRAAFKHMIRNEYGRVINIASIAARRGRPDDAFYTASKFAMVGLTQSSALAVARKGINVNAICPGFVQTAMTEKIFTARIEKYQTGETFDEAWEKQLSQIPMHQAQTPVDIADCAVFLCSQMSKQITGQAINVDGAICMN